MLLTLRRLFDVLRALVPPPWRPALVTSRARPVGTAVAKARMRRNRQTRGTSLIDVLVGIVISAVLLGIAVPTIPALMDPYRLSFAARVVASQLSSARRQTASAATLCW